MARNDRCTYAIALCPECVQHVRYCAKHEEVSCPFCSHAFVPEAIAGTPPTARAVRRSSKGKLAASFVGATLIAATATGCPMVAEYGMPDPEYNWEEPDVEDDTDNGDAHHDVGDDDTGDDDTGTDE